MKKFELVVVWSTGEKSVSEYPNMETAEIAERNMKLVFGHQIAWSGIIEKGV